MEIDPNPIPKIDLFPRVSKLVHFLFDHIQHPGLSDHSHGQEIEIEQETKPVE